METVIGKENQAVIELFDRFSQIATNIAFRKNGVVPVVHEKLKNCPSEPFPS